MATKLARISEMSRNNPEMIFTSIGHALDALKEIIGDPDINPIARVQAIALVMDRGLSKPEENIKIQHMEANMDEAEKRMDELFEEARRKQRGE